MPKLKQNTFETRNANATNKGLLYKINKHDQILHLVLTLTSKHVLSNKMDHHTTRCTSKAIY